MSGPYPTVELVDGDIIVRQSSISSMLKCPASFGFQLNNVEGVIPTFGEKLEFGSVYHKVAEQVVEGANIIAVTQINVLLETARNVILADGIDWLDYTSEKERVEFCEEIQSAAHVWYKNFWTPYSPYMQNSVAERAINIHIGDYNNRRIVLHGTPDLYCKFDDVNTMFDWKTSGRAWKPDKPHYELQGPFYMSLISSVEGEPYRKACFLIYDRSKGVLDELWTERDDSQVESAIQTAITWGELIGANVFPPTPVVWEYQKPSRGWYCSVKYCDAWNVCHYKYLPDGKNEQEVKVLSWK